uniref:Uncharacterized protein n=1 Tax=Photinus pyralis TaxID=7054 RepID=A0A1Y1K8C3_PHOPY
MLRFVQHHFGTEYPGATNISTSIAPDGMFMDLFLRLPTRCCPRCRYFTGKDRSQAVPTSIASYLKRRRFSDTKTEGTSQLCNRQQNLGVSDSAPSSSSFRSIRHRGFTLGSY